jgi:hypothetical protein
VLSVPVLCWPRRRIGAPGKQAFRPSAAGTPEYHEGNPDDVEHQQCSFHNLLPLKAGLCAGIVIGATTNRIEHFRTTAYWLGERTVYLIPKRFW